jgi:hypothetical protein
MSMALALTAMRYVAIGTEWNSLQRSNPTLQFEIERTTSAIPR